MSNPSLDIERASLVAALEACQRLRDERDQALRERDAARFNVCCLLAAGEDRVYERQWGHHSYHAWLGAQTPAEVAHRMGWEFSPKDKP